MIQPMMQNAKGDGIRMQLAIWEGAGPTVLCIHGMTANCRCWDRIVAGIGPYCRIIAVDLRGRGLSDKPSQGYSVNRHVQDIDRLMQDQNMESVVLLGHSLGAYVCLSFAARYPERVRGLILLDGGGQLSRKQWDHIEMMIQPSLERLGQIFPSFDAYIENLKKAPVFQPWSSVMDTYFQYEIEEVEGGIRSRIDPDRIQKEVAQVRQIQALPLFSQIECSVLILRSTIGIFSRDDLVLPESAAQKMLETISTARRVDVVGANHFSILFQPFKKRDLAIADFLSDLR